MRILMLGNSFTSFNNMPSILAELIDAEVVAHTRGGARLAEHLNRETDMGARTLAALEKESWDYVILQEQSNAPITSKTAFLKSVFSLCKKIRDAGSVPILYATWAYKKDCERIAEMGISYDVMAALMSAAYQEAAEQCEALVADVGNKFYLLSGRKNLYAEDGCHPSEEGSRIAAETIASVIIADQKKNKKIIMTKSQSEVRSDDQRLRLLYLYQMLIQHTDPEHPMSTNEIRVRMEKEHGITMHRTTLPSDVALLQAAGVPIQSHRTNVMLYYMEEARFELAELKILIDAVESSKFITEKKSRALVDKLTMLTSDTNAVALKRNLHTAGRVRSGNEKGYYIVDAINEAINNRKRITLFYTDFDEKKRLVLRNNGNPYTVSPYTLIWNGDYYYLVGWYHEKERVTVFRVDRILSQPVILDEKAYPQPKGFNVSHYTNEVFRMYDTEEIKKVTLCCENHVMKAVIDVFGMDIKVKKKDRTHFMTKVSVCASPTFYGWVFQWGGAVTITAPEEVVEEFRGMTLRVLDGERIGGDSRR